MLFTTLKGNSVPLNLKPYKINWKAASLSKFQTNIKNFFGKYFKHLDWYEEVPLVGADVSRLRWDFLCVFEDDFGRKQKVFIEIQGQQHFKMNGKFHRDIKDFENQVIRDEIKSLFAAKNSLYPVMEFFEGDPLPTIKSFEEEFGKILPRK